MRYYVALNQPAEVKEKEVGKGRREGGKGEKKNMNVKE